MSKKFGFETRALEVVENVDLTGYEVIITGGASGIGIETVRALAKAGASVIILARDLKKAQEVADNIKESTGNKNIEIDELELGSLESVNAFVKRFLEKKRPLNILINNAGIMACPLSYTKDGFELQFGTNYIGHFALTVGLIPALKKGVEKIGKNSRIINVSSIAHALSDINFDDINYKNRAYEEFESYGQSKTANILFSVELTKRYSKEGIFSNALMPGGILTNLGRHMNIEILKRHDMVDEDGNFKSKFKFKTVEQGASTTVWAAVAQEFENVGGVYLEDCAIAEVIKTKEENMMKGCLSYALNSENARKLWEISEKMISEAKL